MPNINSSEDMSQVKIFVTDRWTDWQTNRRTNEWVYSPPPNFAKVRGQNRVVFSPNVVLIESFACRARIDWYLVEFIVRYDWRYAFCRWSIFFLLNILDDKIWTQFVIHYKSRCPHNAVWNTMYYKLRCNSTQFVMYYKLRNYYILQRTSAVLQWFSCLMR